MLSPLNQQQESADGRPNRNRNANPFRRPSFHPFPSSRPIPTPSRLRGGMRTAAEAHQSRLLYELSALLLSVLRWPEEEEGPRPRQVTAAGVASMLLGASMALMLCGSVTFMLGFFLMPWVVGLACVFLFVGFVTNLSGIGRAILCWPASSPKDASAWHIFSKPPFMQM